jgi:HSP20 family protein
VINLPFNIISRPFWRIPDLVEEDSDDWFSALQSNQGGLTVSEDDQCVYVSASLPGVDEKDIDITFDKGVLWIKGETKLVEEKRKYYRKASSNFAYSISIPGDINSSIEPDATYKNGVMTVVFTKTPQSQPKKIAIKGHK